VARSIVGNIPSLTISQPVSTDIWSHNLDFLKGALPKKTDSLHPPVMVDFPLGISKNHLALNKPR
jgi:hypothetical protein